MNIFIAGVSGESQYVKSLRSFYALIPRPGDYKKEKVSGRGDINRMILGEMFYEDKSFDAIAMFDLDMQLPPNILEVLRTDMERDNLDMVTGHYYSRNSTYIHSVCWELGNGRWPYLPMMHPPRTGIHEIGMTGMGCVLIKRQAYEAVLNYLPVGDRPFSIGVAPEVTGDARTLGTDFRFFSLARLLGYRLWLDAGIECLHATMFWVGREMAEKLDNQELSFEYLDAIADQIRKADGMDKKYLETRLKALEARLKEIDQKYRKAKADEEQYILQANQVKAVMTEDKFLLEQMGKEGVFPTATEAEKNNLIENRTGIAGVSEKEAALAREQVMQREAQGFVDDIQTVKGS